MNMMEHSALNISHLSKQYRDHHAIRDISLTLQQGEVIGLLGANGAGKSTLLKSTLLLIHADHGTIDLFSDRYAYLPEQPHLPRSLPIKEILAFKSRSCHSACKIEQILSDVGLAKSSWSKPVQSYSKGMRQRAALAVALCNRPELLLLDEPMSGLDALGRSEILALLKKHKRQGTAMLISSHIVPDMIQICDKILIMAHGQIRETVTIQSSDFDQVHTLETKLAHWTHIND